MTEEKTKKCDRCGRTLPASAFHRNSSNADGLNDWCRQCRRADYVRKHGNGLSKYTDDEIRAEYEKRFGPPAGG